MSPSQKTNAHISESDGLSNDDATVHVPSYALPSELWLQILEFNARRKAHLAHLWCTVRLVSRLHRSLVERLFTTTSLPTVSLSLILPRRHPDTEVLLHMYSVPSAEVTLQDAQVQGDMLTVTTRPTVRDGTSMELLREQEKLSKRRLDTATSVWMSFKGYNKATSRGSVKMPIDVEWNDHDKVWQLHVEWRKMFSSYFHDKR